MLSDTEVRKAKLAGKQYRLTDERVCPVRRYDSGNLSQASRW
jgi:hypothetical protein